MPNADRVVPIHLDASISVKLLRFNLSFWLRVKDAALIRYEYEAVHYGYDL